MVTEGLRNEVQLEGAANFIRERFEETPTTTWRNVIDREHRRRAIANRETIKSMVRDAIVEAVTDERED